MKPKSVDLLLGLGLVLMSYVVPYSVVGYSCFVDGLRLAVLLKSRSGNNLAA